MANQQDADFVQQATASGIAEITMGTLAAQRAPGFATNEFGVWMVTDHTLVNQQISSLAASLRLPVATAATPSDQAMAANLSQLSGLAFEQQYLAAEVAGHQNAINTFLLETQSGSDPNLVAYAQSVLPALVAHYGQAVALQVQVQQGNLV